MLQALAHEHHVTVLSWQPIAIEPINRFFGTSLQSSQFDTVVVPRHWRFVPDRLPVPAALLRSSLLMRYTRRINDAFDVIIGCHNECDYGRRGIQYVHYPSYLRPRPDADLRWYHRTPALSRYYRLSDWLADFSLERMKSNTTLANSDWTARQIRKSLGVDAITVYPPVVDAAPAPPWSDRQRGFIAIGRISPEKLYERVMRILARVRVTEPDITLTIVGTWDRGVRRYYEELRRLAASLGPWIQFRQNVSRDEMRQLMATHRYGIHGMADEHFGMAPAEMARAGMIVWVPNGGGQIEIVGNEAALLYEDEREAAEKIARVLRHPVEEQRLHELLAERSKAFGTDRFVTQIQAIVREFRR
jgi:glycosyltransferase involved in cell wall biosynthesis